MSKFLSPTLAAVTPYTPGEQPQDQQYIKLNTNESPYLPSPAVIAAVSEHEVEKLRLYSDPACADLLKAAAAHFGLQPEQIMPGNGSDENLFFALRAFCDADHPLAYADITYGCYGVWCGLMHIPSHIIPLKEDFTLDPKDYYGLNQYIKLNTNESPYLPSPAVIAAVSEHEVEKLRLYSDPACADLLKAAAAHFGLQPEQIMPGNGSDENLFFALRAFCDADHPLAYADITYGCYGVWCGLMHIPSHIIPLKEDFTLDPKDYYGLNQTIVLANPNAPTGIALPRAEIEGILKANPNNVVIVDEAYVDFGGESCVPLIDQYENLLVVQTFSKSRQLAGARLGLAMGNAKLIADLNRVKFSLNPYNINRLTLKAGQAALEDTAYFDRTRAAIVDTRAWTKQQLEQRGFAVLDSRSNFLFASTNRKDGGTLYKELKKNGILVRHFDAPRIQNWLRITIGTPEQMQTFMETLDKIMEE